MTRLTDDEIHATLADALPGWELQDGALTKEFVFPGFRAAIAFIDRVAEEAHAARHHPDLRNRYNRVNVSLTTHDEGGISEKDVALARAIEAVVDIEA